MAGANDLYLTDEQYLKALEHFRNKIEEGAALEGEDSTCIGDKYTTCTWGLCSMDNADWPDKYFHLWPERVGKREYTSASIKYKQDHQLCHLDTRQPEGDNFNGCFYTCRFFQRRKDITPLTKESALKLIDTRIAQIKERMGKRG